MEIDRLVARRQGVAWRARPARRPREKDMNRIASSVVLASLAALVACGGGGGGTGGGTVISLVVGPAGGTFEFQDGAVTLVVPAGAVAADTTVTITPSAASAPSPAPVAGTFFSFSPEGTTFAQPVQLTLRYDLGKLPAGTDPATMQLSKATSDGWESLATTIDTAARTATAELHGFSSWGLTPGLTAVFGSSSGVATRVFDGWSDVLDAKLATDTSGAVYLLGSQYGTAGPLPGSGVFLARLNANLTVQWLRPVDSDQIGRLGLALDQQGNAFVFTSASHVGGASHPFVLTSFNPSGAVRSGFPVTWGGAATVQPSGLAIDGLGRAHVFGFSGASTSQRVLAPSYGVWGNSGESVRTPGPVALGAPTGVTELEPGDLALDLGGRVYFEAFYMTGSGAGTVVQALRVHDLGAVSGYPLTLPSQVATGFARQANSLASAAMTQVPMAALSDSNGLLDAFDVIGTGQSSGFPVTIPGGFPEAAAVNPSGTIWLAGQADDSGSIRLWVNGYSPAGVGRTPRILGMHEAGNDIASDVTCDPAGVLYVTGHSTGAGPYTFWIAQLSGV
jgi:hypothetical protein